MPAPRARTTREGIVTPEAVLLEFAEAGLGSRALAFCVDLAVRGAILFGVALSMAATGVVLDATLAVVVGIATVFAVVLVYPVAFETFTRGRTPGKMVLGLRVVTVEGAPVRFRHCAVRGALGLVDFLVGGGCFAVVSALATRRSQRLGDLAAGTVVIRERQASGPSAPVEFRPPPGWEAWTDAVDVSQLDDDAYVLVRALLLRVHELERGARRDRTAALAERIAGRLGGSLPEGTDAEAFLVAVAAAYQRRGAPAVGTPPVDGPAGTGPGVSAPPPVVGAAPPPVAVDDAPADTWGR